MDIARVIYHHEPTAGGAESPDVEGWSAAAQTYVELHRLVEDGIPFALEREGVRIEHYVPAGERVPA